MSVSLKTTYAGNPYDNYKKLTNKYGDPGVDGIVATHNYWTV